MTNENCNIVANWDGNDGFFKWILTVGDGSGNASYTCGNGYALRQLWDRNWWVLTRYQGLHCILHTTRVCMIYIVVHIGENMIL